MSTAIANTESGLAVVGPTPLPTPVKGPRLGLPSQEELNALLRYGEIVVKSGMAPAHIKSPEAALVVMRYAHQLGIDEFVGLQNMYVIGGKPAAMASLLHALILRDHGGSAIQIKEMSGQQCVLLCKRADTRESVEISYTIEEAKAANLAGKDIWKQYPADMLFARCVSRAGRAVFRDSTMGMYLPEELGRDIIEVRGEVIDVGVGEVHSDDQPRSNHRLANLHRIGGERGLDHEGLSRIAFTKNLSLRQITDTMLADFEALIETAADADLALWSTDWELAIETAEPLGVDPLKLLGQQIKQAGITQDSHVSLANAFAAALKRAKAKEAAETKANALPAEPVEAALPGITADPDRFTA